MRKEIAIPVMALSIGMNVALVGIWIGQAAMAERTGTENEGKISMRHPLHAREDLTDDQRAALEPRIIELRKRTGELNDRLARLKAKLLDLIASEDTDMKALAAVQEEIVSVQASLQEIVVEQLLAEKEILTPEQRKDLFDKIRNRCGCYGRFGSCGPGGSGNGCSRPEQNDKSGPCNSTKGENK